MNVQNHYLEICQYTGEPFPLYGKRIRKINHLFFAKLLAGEDQDIILIDENQERLGKMSSNLDMMTVNYSPTSINGLKEAGVAAVFTPGTVI